MRARLSIAASIAVLSVAVWASVAAVSGQVARIVDLRVGKHPNFDRLVLEFERPVTVVQRLNSSGRSHVFEIEARIIPPRQTVDTGLRRLGRVRIGPTESGAVVAIPADTSRIRAFLLHDPERLVIDVTDAGAAPFKSPPGVDAVALVGPPVPAPEPPSEPVAEVAPPPPEVPEPVAEGVPPPPEVAEPVADVAPAPPEVPEPVAEAVPPPPEVTEPVAEAVPPPPEVTEPVAEAVPPPPEVTEPAADVAPAPAAAPPAPEIEEAATRPRQEPAPAEVRSAPAPVPGTGSHRTLNLSLAVLFAAALTLASVFALRLWLRVPQTAPEVSGAPVGGGPDARAISVETIEPEELADRGDRIGILERRIDEEVRARMQLEEQLSQLHDDLKGLRHRLHRVRRRGEGGGPTP